MEIALNPSSKRKTNVVVSIEGNERKFGDDAMVVCVKKPKYCYAYLLDLLGKKVDHPTVTAYKTRFPQYDIEADPIRGTVIFRHDSETTYRFGIKHIFSDLYQLGFPPVLKSFWG